MHCSFLLSHLPFLSSRITSQATRIKITIASILIRILLK